MIARLLGRVLALLALLALAAPARAQGVYGPPLPGAGAPALPMPSGMLDASLQGDALNPLQVLAGAGQVLSKTPEGASAPSSGKSGGLSAAVNILVVLTVVTLAPSIVLMCTCFVRILIVLGFLRQAMGTQSIPPPQVVTGLALFATLLVMTPTIERVQKEAIAPFSAGTIQNYDELWTKAKQPLRDFMFSQIEASGNWSSVYMILDYRGIDTSQPENLTRAKVDMVTLVPAYMLSELKVAFLMGFKVFLPFLVIDMVVSTMLISMSMMMLPPVLISLPFKVLLFVLVDGWTLVIGSLMHSFRSGEAQAAAGPLVDVLAGAHAALDSWLPAVG